MDELVLDLETTFHNKGSVFDERNFPVCYSIATKDGASAIKWSDHAASDLQKLINASDLLIVCAGKFDVHWLRKMNISLGSINIWDVQIAEFILSYQKTRFPSLDGICSRLGLPVKPDVVRTEYWEKGINTDEIPWPILSEYSTHDASVTYQCYKRQWAEMNAKQRMLSMLQSLDMCVLQEMEANGLLYDEQLCITRSKEVDDKISEIKGNLASLYPNVPINFGSVDDLSAFLYGGIIYEDTKEHVGFYKTGEKAGQPKYKNVVVEHRLPRLFKPLPGSELAKDNLFSTSESTLKQLRGNKKIIQWLLELAKLEKRNSTYYKGLVKLRKTKNWPENILHGKFNQVVAATGRLSSSEPNLQNFDSELQDIFISRFND